MNKSTEFQNWFSDAKKGDQFVYHSGLLAAQRGLDNELSKRTAAELAADEVACLAWALMQSGRVALTQRRVRAGVCDYLAVKN